MRKKPAVPLPPRTAYVASLCAYPLRSHGVDYLGRFERRLVSRNGGIRWKNAWVNVSHALAAGYVSFEEVADGIWAVYFGPVLLGRFDDCNRRFHGAHNRNKL